MSKILLGLAALVLLLVIAGGAALAFVDIPVPTTKVEKTLPDARFPR